MDSRFEEIAAALVRGDAVAVRAGVTICLETGVEPTEIMARGLIAGMGVIGHQFKNNEIYMPEVMIAARAMNAGLELLDPILSRADGPCRAKMILGTVRGDLHDVGKNMVSMFFRGAGYEVVDLGVDVPEARFVEAIREHRPRLVGLSALLSTTVPQLSSTVKALGEAGLRSGLVVMVGGAPVTQEYADSIGADGYAPDAASAVDKAAELLAAVAW
ncbi:MAG: corrinoid protein [Thermodesulfobacteriota bacterium]